MVTVEQLYKDFGVLADAKDKAGEHVTEYKSILSAVKGGPSEKRLASQFIARFFKHFPTLAENAIEAQLDLCEDEDAAIRKQAIKELPIFARDAPDHVPRIADILTQLLQSEDPTEINVVQSALLSLFSTDAKGALRGLFLQILEGEDIVRERAIKFMSNKMKQVPEEIMTKEVEEYFVTESKKVLEDVTGDEFVAFMKILSGLKTMSTLVGRQQLLEIITEQADLDKTFEPSDPDCTDRLVQCVRQALPLFSKNVHASRFVSYICDNVLPVLSEVTNVEEVEPVEGADSSTPATDMQLEILKILAEMSQYCADMENTQEKIAKVFERLLEYMPLPPADTEDRENTLSNDVPKLQFSYVECLMYTFHQLGRQSPDFLTSEEKAAEKLKDFRLRLQFFARGVQVYIKQLRAALQGKTGDALKTDENKIKVVALKITNNINTLIKDLFHNPPSYKATVTLSWKPIGAKATSPVSPGQKRPGITPITYEGGDAKKAAMKPTDKMGDRKLYSPPTGKWSEKSGSYPQGARGGNRGGGSRGFRGGYGRGRGRGRGRGWNRW